MTSLLPLLFVLTLTRSCEGFPMFQTRIPNGDNVASPCHTQDIWPGVGHLNPEGGGDRNCFGLDFYANGKEWTEALCRNDSDGDGLTNGYELGDPDCVWTPGSQPSRTTNITHPGICEPLRKKNCRDTVVASSRYPRQELWLSDVCPKAQFNCYGVTFNRSEDLKTAEFRLPHLKVPAKETTYMCLVLPFPDVDRDSHVFAFEPIIVNKEIVHHMVLYGVPEGLPYTEESGVFECGMVDNAPTVGGWTLGLPGLCYHHTLGFRFGKTGLKKLLLEVHWNNPEKIENLTDSSGLRVYYTHHLRPLDAAILVLGQSYIEVEARSPHTVITGTCSETCTKNLFTGDIKVFAVLPHMHLLGRSLTVSQYRQGCFVRHIADDPYYDFNNPTLFGFEEPIILKRGDVLRTECRYTATHKNTTTYYGIATSDEMCYAYLIYAPAQNIRSEPLCVAWRSLLKCDQQTFGKCKVNSLDKFAFDVFPKTRLYRSVVRACKKPGHCTKRCFRSISKANKGNSCLGIEKSRLFVESQYLKEYDAGRKFLEAYDSC